MRLHLSGLGDCDPSALPGDASFCGGSVYGVDSAGNTIVNPGLPSNTNTIPLQVLPTGTPTAQPTFAQSFFTQTGIQLQSAALFVAAIVFVVSMGGKKR